MNYLIWIFTAFHLWYPLLDNFCDLLEMEEINLDGELHPDGIRRKFRFSPLIRVSSHPCENHHLVNLIILGSGAYYSSYYWILASLSFVILCNDSMEILEWQVFN